MKSAGFTPGVKGYLKRAPSELRGRSPFSGAPISGASMTGLNLRPPRGMLRGPMGPDLPFPGNGDGRDKGDLEPDGGGGAQDPDAAEDPDDDLELDA